MDDLVLVPGSNPHRGAVESLGRSLEDGDFAQGRSSNGPGGVAGWAQNG